MTEAGEGVRRHLALALDLPDAAAAVRLARRLRPWFGVAKIGLELFVAEGPVVVRAAQDEGYEVFLDLKLHDIPNTVGRAAGRAAALGVRYLTVHAAGGRAMLEAAVGGYSAESSGGARGNGAGILAVTVLTSDPVARPEDLRSRAQLAAEVGCVGAVCAAPDLAVVRDAAPGLVLAVPGIRLPESAAGDQARIATPEAALAAGADLLVIGRTVTSASDPEAAAARVAELVAEVTLSS